MNARSILAVVPLVSLGALAQPSPGTANAEKCVTIEQRRVCATGRIGANRPLLIFLHGYGTSGADDLLGLANAAAAAGYVYAAPDALPNSEGVRQWRNSDVAFIAKLIAELVAATGADPK